MTWSLGSVHDAVLTRVDNVPTNLSGAELLDIAYEQQIFVEEFTGLAVGSVGIDDKFRGVLTNLTIAETTSIMLSQGADVSEAQIGDFKLKVGGDTNISAQHKTATLKANSQLKTLGKSTRTFKVNG